MKNKEQDNDVLDMVFLCSFKQCPFPFLLISFFFLFNKIVFHIICEGHLSISAFFSFQFQTVYLMK